LLREENTLYWKRVDATSLLSRHLEFEVKSLKHQNIKASINTKMYQFVAFLPLRLMIHSICFSTFFVISSDCFISTIN